MVSFGCSHTMKICEILHNYNWSSLKFTMIEETLLENVKLIGNLLWKYTILGLNQLKMLYFQTLAYLLDLKVWTKHSFRSVICKYLFRPSNKKRDDVSNYKCTDKNHCHSEPIPGESYCIRCAKISLNFLAVITILFQLIFTIYLV